MLHRLISIANTLDAQGLYAEADIIDEILVNASVSTARSNLIRALKDDRQDKAMDALTSLVGQSSNPAQELGMDSNTFREFVNAIRGTRDKNGIYSYRLSLARKLFGVGKDEALDPNKYNPVTQQPWSSGPVSQKQKYTSSITLTPSEKQLLLDFLNQNDLDHKTYGWLVGAYDYFKRFLPKASARMVSKGLVKSLLYKIKTHAMQTHRDIYQSNDFSDI